MQIYDRLKSVTIDDKNLPNQIDLGRFYIVNTKEELTNRTINAGSDKIILQDLLDNQNKSLQDLFCYFHAAVNRPESPDFSIIPLIQSVKEKLFLNKFEEFLESNIFHLEEIFRQPHYVLQRIYEKVNVSRAKRIPNRSYQNLASHTEDWLHKSIVNFKPRRILTEELDLDYDVYENQVTVALVERCLLYLNSRIQEIHDIGDFLIVYEKLLSDRDDASGWYKKIERNLSLIGCVYEDENYFGQRLSKKEVLSTTQQRLLQMSKRLKALQNSSLFSEVNHRMVMSHMSEQDVMPTNVIANHQHYRYVRDLWRALNTVDKEKSNAERIQYEQDVIDGVRCYAKAMMVYIVKNILNYQIEGTYSKWTAIHPFYSPISFTETEKKLLCLDISGTKIAFLPICNPASFSDSKLDKDIFVLSLNCKCSTAHIIGVSPYDADSVERVGKIIKTYLLKAYLSKITEQHEYRQALKDYVSCVSSDDISFQSNYFYTFKGIPQPLVVSDVMERLSGNESYKRRSRMDQNKIRSEMETLVGELNDEARKLASSILCFDCLMHIDSRSLKQLDYIVCPCGFVLDSSGERVLFHNIDSKYSSLLEEDWGMDYLAFNKE